MKPLLRKYWRQVLILVLLGLPVLTLIILGVVWLAQSEWLIYVIAGMAISTGAVGVLSISIKRDKLDETKPEPEWAPEEKRVWGLIQKLAFEAEKAPPNQQEGWQSLAERVVRTAANELHDHGDFAHTEFTIPELLYAIERASESLRYTVRQRLPLSDLISVADVKTVIRFYDKNKSLGVLAMYAYRAFRVYSNPVNAVFQETNGLVRSGAVNSVSGIVQGWLARQFVEELGRAAINLYAGRYRLSETEVRQMIVDRTPANSAPVPIRVLLAGQVNVGKSSLTNALLGSVKSPVSELPTPGGIREFRVNSNEDLDLVILDSHGLMSPGDIHLEAILDQCAKVDLIMWITKATNPARDLDEVALAEIRKRIHSSSRVRPPSLMLVMTHVDKVSPAREWSPPYDLNQSENAKARNISNALTHVAQALGFSDDPQVPVAIGPNEQAYNLEAVWAAIGERLSAAQHTALDRELKRGNDFNLSQTLTQCREGGRFVLGKVMNDWRK